MSRAAALTHVWRTYYAPRTDALVGTCDQCGKMIWYANRDRVQLTCTEVRVRRDPEWPHGYVYRRETGEQCMNRPLASDKEC